MVYNINLQEGLNTVEVFDGRKFMYRFTPATYSRGAPLLVIASSRGAQVPSKFRLQDWNVLSVVDTFGRMGDMTAYLGEGGDFFIKELLYELVQSAIKKCECVPRDNLFFYSSSIASGSSIGQGILFEARAVYLNAPIIKVHDTTIYKSKYMDFDKAIDFVIPPHMKNVVEADAVRYLKAHKDKKMPTFILCDSKYQSEEWLQNFLEEHTFYFMNACKEEGIEVYLELVETEGHKIHYKMPEVIEAFNKYAPPKYLDLIDAEIFKYEDTLTVNCILGKDYPLPGDAQYAFYLMYKGEKKEVKWYGNENKTVFVLEKGMNVSKIEIIAFAKDQDGIIISKIKRI